MISCGDARPSQAAGLTRSVKGTDRSPKPLIGRAMMSSSLQTGPAHWATAGGGFSGTRAAAAGQTAAASPRPLEGSHRQMPSLASAVGHPTTQSTSALTRASSSARMHSPRATPRLEAAGGALGLSAAHLQPASVVAQAVGVSIGPPLGTSNSQGTGYGVQRMVSAGMISASAGCGASAGSQRTYPPPPPQSARLDRSHSPLSGSQQSLLPRAQSKDPPNTSGKTSRLSRSSAMGPPALSPSITPRPLHMQMPSSITASAGLSSSPWTARVEAETGRSSGTQPPLLAWDVAAGPRPSTGPAVAAVTGTRPPPLVPATPIVKRSKSDGHVLRH